MANVFEALYRGAKDSIDSPLRVARNLKRGEFSEAFKNLKHMPGNQERANQDILGSVGVRGWVGKHPGLSAAAVVGSIFGGAYAAGAYGAGSTAAGAGASTAGTTTAASAGATGATVAPTTASATATGTGASSGFSWTNAISQMASAAPSGGMQPQQPQPQAATVQPAPNIGRGFQPVNLSGTLTNSQPDYMNQINNIINGVR